MDLNQVPEGEGMDDYESFPTTPLSVLGRDIPHQFRAVSPMTQSSGDFQPESVELNASSTVSSEPPDSDTSSRNGNDASSSGQGAPTPTAVRTAAHLLGARMLEAGDSDEIREGRRVAQTRALNREAAAGLISTIASYQRRSHIPSTILAAQKQTR